MKANSIDRWESAWGEYVEALETFDETFPSRERRGHVRAHKSARYRLHRSRAALRKIDADFCQRVGV